MQFAEMPMKSSRDIALDLHLSHEFIYELIGRTVSDGEEGIAGLFSHFSSYGDVPFSGYHVSADGLIYMANAVLSVSTRASLLRLFRKYVYDHASDGFEAEVELRVLARSISLDVFSAPEEDEGCPVTGDSIPSVLENVTLAAAILDASMASLEERRFCLANILGDRPEWINIIPQMPPVFK